MRKRDKDRWVKALRSGKYKQGKSYLARESETGEWQHCCLGVLCELDGIGSRVVREGIDGPFKVFGGSASDYLPPSLMRKYGIGLSTQRFLGRMNDDEGADFNDIADWIEEHL